MEVDTSVVGSSNEVRLSQNVGISGMKEDEAGNTEDGLYQPAPSPEQIYSLKFEAGLL